MSLTLEDIAKQIGVSNATISRVLTGGGYVKDETRKLVEDALAKNNYVYIARKRRSMSRIAETVLVITGDITSSVYAAYIKGINQVLEKAGKKVFIYYSNYIPEKEEEYLGLADKAGFNGVIMLNAVETPTLVKRIEKKACPVIMVNRYLRSVSTDAVAIDNFRGGYMATAYLIQHGHTRIAHLAGAGNSSTSQERLRGFTEAMNMAQLKITDDAVFHGELHYAGGYAFGEMLCAMTPEERFTAVYSANDLMTMGMIDALYNGGLSIPADVSVICMDNSERIVNGRVRITAVDYDPEKMGVAAAEMLLSRIKNPDKETRQIIYSPELVERGSVKRINGNE